MTNGHAGCFTPRRPPIRRVPSLGNLASDHSVELQLSHADTSTELSVRCLVAEQDADAVAVPEGVVGEDNVDARVDVRQQPPHAGHEIADRSLAAPVANRLVDHEV